VPSLSILSRRGNSSVHRAWCMKSFHFPVMSPFGCCLVFFFLPRTSNLAAFKKPILTPFFPEEIAVGDHRLAIFPFSMGPSGRNAADSAATSVSREEQHPMARPASSISFAALMVSFGA